MTFDEARKIRKRNRVVAQRNYTFNRIQSWNHNKNRLINFLLDLQANNINTKRIYSSNNLRRAEHLSRNDGQYRKAVQSLLSSGLAPVNEETIQILESKHPFAPLPNIVERPDLSFKVQSKQILK